ncbi:hypothetical protein GCM10010329_62390 [Streptomyces spiroverticillatus]|nr:hypothetical protein GCM10010329_62390 [Streptomyces spiroverticillatus]
MASYPRGGWWPTTGGGGSTCLQELQLVCLSTVLDLSRDEIALTAIGHGSWLGGLLADRIEIATPPSSAPKSATGLPPAPADVAPAECAPIPVSTVRRSVWTTAPKSRPREDTPPDGACQVARGAVRSP